MDIPENPEVPNIDGLNSIREQDFSEFIQPDGHCRSSQSFAKKCQLNSMSFSFQGSHEPPDAPTPIIGGGSETVNDLDLEDLEDFNQFGPDMLLFDEKELIILLVAHDIAKARRHNSSASDKLVDSSLSPLVSEEMAREMHRLFKADAIIEVIGVFASFEMLHRWTTCFDYRFEALDSVVRQFIKTDVGKRLGVDKVGQRNLCSEFSEGLRGDCRSLKIPRHAVVSAPLQFAHLRQMSAT